MPPIYFGPVSVRVTVFIKLKFYVNVLNRLMLRVELKKLPVQLLNFS